MVGSITTDHALLTFRLNSGLLITISVKNHEVKDQNKIIN